MNFEAIEQRCLKALSESDNPLVPVDTLLRLIQPDNEADGVSRPDLMAFLRQHELFMVMDAPSVDEGGAMLEALSAAGLISGPYAVLETRRPSQADWLALMAGQLDVLGSAMGAALREAEQSGDEPRARQVRAVLKRIDAMVERLKQV
jgi:hypothetical protein